MSLLNGVNADCLLATAFLYEGIAPLTVLTAFFAFVESVFKAVSLSDAFEGL